MVVDAGRLSVETLARAAAEIAAAADRATRSALARAAVESSGADLAVVRVVTVPVTGRRASRPRLVPRRRGRRDAGPCEVLAGGSVSGPPNALRTRPRGRDLAQVARGAGDRVIGSLELIRVAEPFDDAETRLRSCDVAARTDDSHARPDGRLGPSGSFRQ